MKRQHFSNKKKIKMDAAKKRNLREIMKCLDIPPTEAVKENVAVPPTAPVARLLPRSQNVRKRKAQFDRMTEEACKKMITMENDIPRAKLPDETNGVKSGSPPRRPANPTIGKSTADIKAQQSRACVKRIADILMGVREKSDKPREMKRSTALPVKSSAEPHIKTEQNSVASSIERVIANARAPLPTPGTAKPVLPVKESIPISPEVLRLPPSNRAPVRQNNATFAPQLNEKMPFFEATRTFYLGLAQLSLQAPGKVSNTKKAALERISNALLGIKEREYQGVL
ncbi:unnamed protein product [Caenorhabditis auriculariae]|uniref:Uncharacterized protein n=1 Tax=Caenorhabditis auriculariae TaxID=2777116 RepID=A0A8S1HRT3_9PELO|nr:unnamed protein product [Caenorhabditis auriculariae]